MNQLFFMIPSMLIGVFGSLFSHPYLGVIVYYIYAVLRPQFIWQWSLPDFAWSFYVGIATLLSILFWKTGVLSYSRDENELNTNVADVIFMLFGGWVIITYFMAVNKDVAYPYLVDYLKIFIMMIAARYALNALHRVWHLYFAVTFVICYIAYEMNSIYFFQGYLFVYRRGYGGLDNNGAALMLAMGVPLCVYAWDGLRHWIRWLFILFVPIILHAVLSTYSRGAMLSIALITPLFLIRCRRRVQLLIMLIAVGAMIPFLAGKEIRERFFSIQEHEMDESANSRKNSWSIAFRLAMENPVFGLGIRNSNLFTYAYGADIEGRTIHSQWLQIAADSGFPALGLYIAVMVAVMYCCHRVRKALGQRDDQNARKAMVMANGVEGSLLLFCIGATFLSLETFELPYILMLMGAQLWSLCEATNGFEMEPARSEDSNEIRSDVI